MDMVRNEIDTKWKWLPVFGALLVVLGMLALTNLQTATAVPLRLIAMCMLAGAVAQFVMWFIFCGFGLLIVSTIFYTVSGSILVAVGNSAFSATTPALAFAIMLILSGGLRVWSSVTLRPVCGESWIIASGSVSVLSGAVLLAGSFTGAVWLPGLLLSIDLMWQGAMAIGFTSALLEVATHLLTAR
ncbi:hypothetical protein GCT13_40935 [Paraburkholderia sp. CNPSo 3157]|uniref:HdeD family acid-resistance protein n=1 Tax=Paraburkholderia franconis TaxID=2654983 RepID=A0A7X1NJT7_9BURK|nr:DUF308 domain-containing protein [Paraburkholderia franconis]MPW22986.1 hypothetical protein [Paraburkholderia franconis]